MKLMDIEVGTDRTECRHYLKFEYPARDLLDSIKQRLDFHRERASYWHDKYKEAIEGRLDATEANLAAHYSNSIRHIDPSQQYLTKQEEHEEKLREYGCWYLAFSTCPDRVVALTAKDLQFFGVRGG